MMEQVLFKQSKRPDRLEVLRQRINDKGYLHDAIQRLALVMSNEIMEVTKEGGRYEWKRKERE